MPPKKKPRRNISGLLNQTRKTTIPAIDVSHEDAFGPIPSRSPSRQPDLNIDDENDEPSKQEDFNNQISMLETVNYSVIQEAGHLCIFLPKFHCELNPIEMSSFSFIHSYKFFNHMTVLGMG